MANYITIDGGTTNTRISIVSGGKIIDTLKFNVGARSGIDNKELLVETVREGIKNILHSNDLDESNIHRILASGMITSEFGLCSLPHTTLPAGISELKASSKEMVLSEISSIPFVFIRGVKTSCEDLENADIMRGEETELMGLISEGDGECVYVLPGSHSKIIKTDSLGRITDFSTMLSGELAVAVAENTILKASLNYFGAALFKDDLIKGYRYCEKHGINNALFKVRILSTEFNAPKDEIYSFYMGAILCDEIKYILKMNCKIIVIAGKKEFREAIYLLLKEFSNSNVIALSDEVVASSVSKGMIRIYENVSLAYSAETA